MLNGKEWPIKRYTEKCDPKHFGYYRIVRQDADGMVAHNAETWNKILRHADLCAGVITFHNAAKMCVMHEHGDKGARYPWQFVTYAITRGWLAKLEW